MFFPASDAWGWKDVSTGGLVDAEHQDGHACQGRPGNDAGSGGDFIFPGFGPEEMVCRPAEDGPGKEEERVIPLNGPRKAEADGGRQPFPHSGKVAGNKHKNQTKNAACNDGKNLDAVQMAESHAEGFRRCRPCPGPRCIESLEGIHVRHQGAERQHGD